MQKPFPRANKEPGEASSADLFDLDHRGFHQDGEVMVDRAPGKPEACGQASDGNPFAFDKTQEPKPRRIAERSADGGDVGVEFFADSHRRKAGNKRILVASERGAFVSCRLEFSRLGNGRTWAYEDPVFGDRKNHQIPG